MKARWSTMVAVALVALMGWAFGVGCMEEGDPTGTTAAAVECSDLGTCAAGEACVAGWCMPECVTDADCPAGVCIVGICEFTPEPWACVAHADCPAGSVCEAGVCVFGGCVPVGEVCNGVDDDCDGVIDEDFDLATDPANCGGCGNVCAAGESCADGVCVAGVPCVTATDCAPGEICLEGVCVGGVACVTDADCDDGLFCTSHESCIAGACVPLPDIVCDDDDPATTDTCDEDTDTCIHTPVGPCVPAPEVCNGLDDDCDGVIDEDFDLTTDPGNCGGCGNVCAAGESCTDGVCVGSVACATDADCDDGLFCTSASYCVSGACVVLPDIVCDDGDPATVDSCDEATDTCLHGGCTPVPEVCNGLDDDCDGMVDEDFDLATDPANCGACGNVCAAGESCVDGVCIA
ncbi:MAG: hypothetical protein JXB32_12040 [Deltaproteobacteria bacterium]|nr:hypothetical protein [Deltaproteobacteria bacterium]